MPNARIQNTVANGSLGGFFPSARVSSFQGGILTPGATTPITPGMPIGLLLALTYAIDMSTTSLSTYRGDTRPNVRLITT